MAVKACRWCGKTFADCPDHPGESCESELLALSYHEDATCRERVPPTRFVGRDSRNMPVFVGATVKHRGVLYTVTGFPAGLSARGFPRVTLEPTPPEEADEVSIDVVDPAP